MAALQTPWSACDMDKRSKDDLDAVLRTLRLAQAQLRAMKSDFANDSAKEQEIVNAEVAIDLLVKKIMSLCP
jgi:hypothetical protein